MAGLLDAVLDAHGGLDNWQQFQRVQATIVTGGGLWAIKGQSQDPLPRRMTVALDHEWASLRPFGADDQKTAFTPERIAELYPSRADYEQRYADSAVTVFVLGFVLPVDRDRLLAFADASAVAP